MGVVYERRPEVRNTVIADPELEFDLEILWNEPDKVVERFIIENGVRPQIQTRQNGLTTNLLCSKLDLNLPPGTLGCLETLEGYPRRVRSSCC